MQFLKRPRETGAQIFGVLRMLEHSCALHVLRAVKAAGEPEMSMQVCPGAFEQRQNFVHRYMIELTDGSPGSSYSYTGVPKTNTAETRAKMGSITYRWREACTSGRLRLKKSTELASILPSLIGIKMFMRKVQPYLAALLAAAISAPPSLAQQKTQTERDSAWYSRVTDRYTSREVAPINLTNSGRIESLLRAGRLYLSLQDAVALALENNLDIELQRYGPRIAEPICCGLRRAV